MLRALALTVLIGLVVLAGCVSDVFRCAGDDECLRDGETGRCELPSSACSFRDTSCPGGYRFADFAPDGLSGTCVAITLDAPPATVPDAAPATVPDAAPATVPDAPPARPDAPLPRADAPPVLTEVDLPDIADTTLDSSNKLGNFGGAGTLRVSGSAVALLRFDPGPAGGRAIDGAELHVFTTASGASDKGSLAVFNLRETWDEGTGNGALGVASWSFRTTFTAWRDQGAGTNGSRDTTMLGNATASTNGAEVVIALDVAEVNAWIAQSSSNDGLILVGNGINGNRTATLVSREGASDQRPFIRVHFAAP